MKLKELFLSHFDDLEYKILDVIKKSNDETTIVIDNFFTNTLLQLESILSKKENKQVKDLLKNEIYISLKEDIKVIDKSTLEVVNLMNKSVKEIVLSNIKNYIFNINVSDIAIKECKNKVTGINSYNKDFIKKFDDQFELFFYNLSITYKLKNDASIYTLINKTINQNKKILFDNLKNIEDKLKEEIVDSYIVCFNSFLKDVKDLKESISFKNNKLLVEYEEEYLKNKVDILVKDTLKENVKKIEKVLLTCHYQVLKQQKSRDIKEKEMELHLLYNYLISFNNTLFDKSLNTLTKMVSSVNLNQEDLDKNIKKYNDIIYKICDFEYNFDKQFLTYRQKMLNRKYFLSTKSTDNIIKLIDDAKIEIISIIKTSIIDLFKTSVNDLNTMTYKRLMSNYKLQNYYEILDSKTIEKLLKN